MKKLNIFLMSMLFALSQTAWAGNANASWTAPTEYEDGSALPGSSIKNYKIYYGNTAGGPYQFSITIPGNTTTVEVTNLTNGTWYFVATTITIEDTESAPSSEVSKVINTIRKPRAPVNFSVG